mgnify:CR=1 FL=1
MKSAFTNLENKVIEQEDEINQLKIELKNVKKSNEEYAVERVNNCENRLIYFYTDNEKTSTEKKKQVKSEIVHVINKVSTKVDTLAQKIEYINTDIMKLEHETAILQDNLVMETKNTPTDFLNNTDFQL